MPEAVSISGNLQLTAQEKRALANHQALGRDLVTQLYICLKTAAFYEKSNENFVKQLGKLDDLMQVAVTAYNEISLTSVEGYLFFNEQRIKINLDGYLAAKYIKQEFEKHKIAGLAIKKGVSRDELSAVILEFVKITPAKRESEEINQEIGKQGVTHITFIPSQEMIEDDEKSERQNAKMTFFRSISVIQEVLTASTHGRQVKLIKAKRAIHSLVDEIISNESYLLELTALRNYDQYTYKHSVNVSVYAVALGIRLGLGKSQLAELGFAALFHDYGKTKIPVDLLNKPDGLSKNDWSLMQEHPVLGAKALARTFPLDRYAGRAILVAFEHHKNLDGTGYPYINRSHPINLFSRIVSLCDFFDALTSGRSYRKEAVPVDQVVLKMIQQSSVKFDPHLIKILVNIIGIYPPGSLLLLDTGELALVVANNPEDIFRPEVKIIADKSGRKRPAPHARLATYDHARGRYTRNVLHMVDPQKYGIDVSEYILAD